MNLLMLAKEALGLEPHVARGAWVLVSVAVEIHMLSELGQRSKDLGTFAPRILALEEVVLPAVV